MATPSEKLAKSLEILKKLQEKEGFAAIRSGQLSRTHRERLLKHGFIEEVLKGWYIAANPEQQPGDSTNWFTSFWAFCAAYLRDRFGEEWCLSPEQSLAIHTGNLTVPGQLLVRSPNAQNNILKLPHDTSIFDLKAAIPAKKEMVRHEGLNLYSLPAALVAITADSFLRGETDARAALGMIRDASEPLSLLLEGGHSTIAGRLAGAFRNIGKDRIANEITGAFKDLGYDVRESDPFDGATSIRMRGSSPYANRIRLMWERMRGEIPEIFPPAPGLPQNRERYLTEVAEKYAADAYNSLSIEGYRVTPELIERVRLGNWNPEDIGADRKSRDAMAARGYWQAFQSVRESLQKVLEGHNPGSVVAGDHGKWYRELFGPSVATGLQRPSDLAGYRNEAVFIRRSRHVPMRPEAVREAMPALLELVENESEASVRAILGHFVFVYIHPYMDGNGRIARFLMNVMLASGGYPWTVIPVEKRAEYLDALEQASVEGNIGAFVRFVAGEMGR